MVKVCFIGISLRLEHAAIERLRSELDVLAQQEPEIEFWFHGFHSDFIKSMLEEVVCNLHRPAATEAQPQRPPCPVRTAT